MRLNIEDDAFPRIEALGILMRWDEAKPLKVMADLWRSSQKLLMVEASREEIAIWTKVFDDGELDRMIELMQRPSVRFLKRKNETTFEIVGNKKQVSAAKKLKKKNTDAAKSRWQKKADKDEKQGPKPTTPTTSEECHRHATGNASGTIKSSAIQCNSIQSNSMQSNINKNIYPSGLDPSDRSLVDDWMQFAQANSKTKFTPNAEEYAKALLSIKRNRGVTTEQMRLVLEFVQRDDFWRPNALSLAALQKKGGNGLPKLQNILQAMDRETREQKNLDPMASVWAEFRKAGDA